MALLKWLIESYFEANTICIAVENVHPKFAKCEKKSTSYNGSLHMIIKPIPENSPIKNGSL